MTILTDDQKREVVIQKMNQLEREIYMNQLNEKILLATDASIEQISFVQNEVAKGQIARQVLENEMILLAPPSTNENI